MIARLITVFLGLAAMSGAQTQPWSYRGFIENRTIFYPWVATNDKTQLVNETFLRFETALRLPAGFKVFAGLDAQTDTHDQVERAWHLSWDDRGASRPAFAARTLNVQYAHGPFRIEAGKQVLHWGVMDSFAPTDRFAPRDYLSPSGSDYLGVFAARAVMDSGPRSVELIYIPRFTPSRVPLTDQRWIIPPADQQSYTYRFRGATYPGGPQFGARYHGIHSSVEYSGCFFEGFENLPSLPYSINPFRKTVDYRALYPKLRMVGADLTRPWLGFLWKAESSYVTSSSPYLANIWTYAIQGEKVREKWQLAGGYTGEYVTDDRRYISAGIDRAMRKSFTSRLAWTPSTKQSLTSEWFLRQNGKAFVARILYSRSLFQSIRASTGWVWIEGRKDDSIGRYHLNSYLTMQFRYSF